MSVKGYRNRYVRSQVTLELKHDDIMKEASRKHRHAVGGLPCIPSSTPVIDKGLPGTKKTRT